MAYAAPGIASAVVLQGGYTAPSIGAPVVLGDGGGVPDLITGALLATLPAPAIPIICTATAQAGIAAALVASLPAPVPAISCEAVGDFRITYTATLAATLPAPALPPLACTAAGQIGITATAAATLPAQAAPAMICASAGEWDSSLFEASGPRAAAPHQHGIARTIGAGLSQQAMQPARVAGAAPHAHAVPVSAGSRLGAAHAQTLRRASRQRHTHGLPLSAGSRTHQTNTLALHRPQRTPHAHGLPLCAGAAARQASTLRPGRLLSIQQQHGLPISKGVPAWHHDAQPVARPLRIRWQHGTQPTPGRWWPWYEPPGLRVILDASPYAPRPLRCRVILGPGYATQPPCPVEPDQPTIIIPTRSAYIVINSVTLRRTDSNAAIEPLSLEISTDADSWLPSFSAEIAFNEFAALAAENGEPLELEAIINGQRWLMLAEGAPSRSRAFGKTSVQIRGRGKAAWLDDPYADHVNVIATADRTAQQLMAEAITSNGASLGWALDWQITDWLVPGGVWSHQGSPMAGVLDVAAAAQAIVQADAAASTLHILPRYPALPWDWASTTPDVQIPLDVIETDSLEPVVQPEYNAVFVAGEGGGIVGHVKRAGTAADRVAPSAGHRLITHADAARQHGGAILSNTGRQARITISMPISAEIPLLQVGQLVSIPEPGDNWRGLVRGVRVSAAWQQSLRVRQTIEIERHYL